MVHSHEDQIQENLSAGTGRSHRDGLRHRLHLLHPRFTLETIFLISTRIASQIYLSQGNQP